MSWLNLAMIASPIIGMGLAIVVAHLAGWE